MTDMMTQFLSSLGAGFVLLVILFTVFCIVFRDKTKSRSQKGKYAERPLDAEKKRMRTMDVILVIIGVTLLVFTVTMILIHIFCGSTPDTLITCVFACLGCECGVMGWIKTSKEKYAEKQDRKEEEKRNEFDNRN